MNWFKAVYDEFRKQPAREKGKTIFTLVMSIAMAVAMWGGVLSNENPYRNKTINNVQTSFEGEAELLAKGLCIRGDRSEILDDVTVRVQTRVTNYTSVDNNSVSASINVKNISEARSYELPVNASISGNLGTIMEVSPAKITVEIDTLVTKTVPISTRFEGSVTDGYWADMANKSATIAVDVQGAKTDIARIKRAECVVDLSGFTTTIFGMYDIVFYDGEGNVIPNDIIVGMIPTSTIRVPVYATKLVPIDAFGSLVGTDSLPAYHTLNSEQVTASPSMVRIVGEKSALDQIDSLPVEPINVSGQSGVIVYESEIILPDGVRMPENSANASVTVPVHEETGELLLEQIPIVVTELAEGLAVSGVDPQLIDVQINGRAGLLNLLSRSDVTLQVSAKGFAEGSHFVKVEQLMLIIRDDATTQELQIVLTAKGKALQEIGLTLVKAE